MSPTNLVYSYLTRANAPGWQQCLHQSVRLYLALDEPGLDTHAVEAALLLLEQQMQWLLVGHAPTSEEASAAQSIIELEQETLLSDPMGVEALRRDISVAQYQPQVMTASLHLATSGWQVPPQGEVSTAISS